MATFKLNIAQIRQCPPPAEVDAAMAEHGLPEGEPFGVLSHSASDKAAFATIARRTEQTVQTLDEATQEITSSLVEKVTVYPIAIYPTQHRLETYAGTASGIDQIAGFLASSLAMPTVVDTIEIDIPAAIEKLADQCPKFRLVAVRVRDYAHNSYMAGPYSPKFLDSQHGVDFLNQHLDAIVSARVDFYAETGKASINLTPKAAFSFSCNEDDETQVQSILRKLI
jgi:hypothetical protein